MLSDSIIAALDRWHDLLERRRYVEPKSNRLKNVESGFAGYRNEQETLVTLRDGYITDGARRSILHRWWEREKLQRADEEHEYAALHFFLDQIDRLFAKEPPEPFEPSPGRILVMGMSWWTNVWMDFMGDRTRKRLPAFGGERFPHLRVVAGSKHTLTDLRNFDMLSGKLSRAAATAELKTNTPYIFRVGLHTLKNAPAPRFASSEPNSEGVGFYALPWSVKSPDAQEYKSALRAAIRWAKEKDIHILSLPELTVCGYGRTLLREALEEMKPLRLSLVIPGSFHFEQNGRRTNSTVIWYKQGSTWLETRGAEKRSSYSYEISDIPANDRPVHALSEFENRSRAYNLKRIYEDIVCPPTTHRFLTSFGLLSITICKDLMDADVVTTLKHPAIDHIFCVSMLDSPKAVMYHKELASVGVATFYVNAAHSVTSGNQGVPLAFWCWPAIMKECRVHLLRVGLHDEGRVDAPVIAVDPLAEEWRQYHGIYCDIPVPKSYERRLK